MNSDELKELRDAHYECIRAIDGDAPGKYSSIARWQRLCTERMPALLDHIDKLELKVACFEAKERE